MANQFVNLPAPAGGNGNGAAVDVSTFGALKSIVVGGNADATINIEINNAVLATDGAWTSVATVQNRGAKTVEVAARWMRMRVSGYNQYAGGAPTADVGGTDDGALFATLVAPAGDGAGAGVDVSALGLFKTVQVATEFRGNVIVEVSEDGGTEWSQPFSFQTPGYQNLIVAAEFMRVRRTGTPQVAPGLPEVFVAATDVGGGGGGGGNADRFQYTVTGLEPDLSELTIPLPAARADALYLVWPAQEDATLLLAMSISTKTVNDFKLTLTGEATAGDVFSFHVADPT